MLRLQKKSVRAMVFSEQSRSSGSRVSNTGRQEINVKSLTKGMYVLRLEGSDKVAETKVLIE